MKNYFFSIFITYILLFSANVFSQNSIAIKSLQTYIGNNQISIPILNSTNMQKSKLTIEFDVDADTPPSLEIKFKFCDKNWVPEDNIFLNDPFRNYANNLSLESLPTTVKMASYHYKGNFPNEQINFPFDGKWIYEIVDSENEDDVFDGGKFIVVSNEMTLNVQIKETFLITSDLSNNELNKAYEMDVSFDLPDSLYPTNVENVEIIQNRLFDFPIIIQKIVTDNRYLDWNGARHYLFGAKDVFPGSSYRQTNLMNINKFSPPSANAQLDRVETSNFYTTPRNDFFGGMKLLDWKNEYAQYMDVNFMLRAPNNLEKDVYLVGAFTDWQVWPSYKMENKDNMYSTNVELKRGIYDYQYVLGYDSGKGITDLDWLYFQGNDFRRRAVYNIFVFYRTPENGGYDKIIAYKRVEVNGRN